MGILRRVSVGILLVAFFAPIAVFSAPAAKTLTFYTIDVEGGKSVLVVSPEGESLLVDAGWPASGNRDIKTHESKSIVWLKRLQS